MPGSYEKVNYSLRPAKNIERKMMCEMFHRLSPFGKVQSYRYIGFGSTYFTDFSLFHKVLGITDMVSIEQDEEKSDRFVFNCPFNCIDIMFGTSNDILPMLSWNGKTILWLDYDSKLDKSMLWDIRYACANLEPGSVITVTVNVRPDKPDDPKIPLKEYQAFRLAKLEERVGEEKVPLRLRKAPLGGWGTAMVCRQIIDNEIKDILSERNGGLQGGRQVEYEQLINFRYSDTAKMLTIGGLIYEQSQDQLLRDCEFDRFEFYKDNDDPFEIRPPYLTLHELRHLDAQLPCDDLPEAPGLSEDEIERYKSVYRYFPRFAEAEI